MKLLLIDVDLDFVRQLQADLRRSAHSPCKLVHVADVDHAADLAARHAFDAILLSVPVEGMEPRDACDALAVAAPNVPLVLLARDHEFGRVDGLVEHVEDVLIKSELSADTLVRRVQYAIERRKSHSPRANSFRPAKRSSHVGLQSPQWYRSHAGATTKAAPLAASTPAASATVSDSRPLEESSQPLRVLQVDGDAAYSRLLEISLVSSLQIECDVHRVSRLADALKCLVEKAFDVILLDPALPDSDGIDTLKQIHPYAEQAPIFVLTKDESDAHSLDSLKHGAEDCHFKAQLDTNLLARSIRMAVARRAGQALVFDRQRAQASVEETRQATTVGPRPSDRRQHVRFTLTRSLVAIPILPNNLPLDAYQVEGFTVDLSEEGIGFEIAGLDRLPTQRLVVGIEAEDGQMYYATIDVRGVISVHGGLRIGAKFSGAERDVLRTENFVPQVNHRTHRFHTNLPTESLYKWAELGICRPVLLDRVLVCPECRALPTLRQGCRACGSVRTAASQLIHHFACAHVGMVSEFETNGELVCPKCRARHLVIGTDFEYLAGPYQCLDCNWSDTELELVGQCMACELRFPTEQASEEEIIGYHVNRLDPLALIAQH